MFTFLLDLITEKGRGIHAYAAASKAAFARALEEPDHAAAFYFLATSAEHFVDLHERQPLSGEELDRNFTAFQDDIHALDAVAQADKAEQLETLNAVVTARIARNL
jgi:hypothetical protein